MFMKADLHIHSTASDGGFDPEQVIMIAKSRGIDTIAISDHNSIDGLDKAFEAGQKHGISVIPAVELSTRFNDESIHILGYFKNDKFNSAAFKDILKQVKKHSLSKLRKALGVYGKHPHSNKYLSCSEGIHLLRTFDAAVVLAHPVRISEKNLLSILSLPFDGIEAKYCRNSPQYTDFFIDIATKQFSFYTGGSDFHTDKPRDLKHCFIGNPYLDSDEIKNFLESSGALVKCR
ncbi:PHP domain-containing protein [Lutispora saccharofermentans]|uniref:PHP domain-containing protein n=1 Tax=Lutispora saccharofermentans TaxID=3024236 RepID=A0ABT1NHM5_9FIRM|nr:PHP domain-containing protein [Lutispora saccharofermentans]MCQ1530744.1 PHP domain-containing protein [Lutispora saccharofermentans]